MDLLPRRDSSVEVEERYERVVSSSMRALSTLVEAFARQEAACGTTASGAARQAAELAAAAATEGSAGTAAALEKQKQQAMSQQQQLRSGLQLAAALPMKPGFPKATFGSSSPAIRAGTYGCVHAFMTSAIDKSWLCNK